MKYETMSISSAVHGFHVYQVIWENPTLGEELCYRREVGNLYDLLAVVDIKQIDRDNTIVGHVY